MIRILSWSLDHFARFFYQYEVGRKLTFCSASYERILVKFFGEVGHAPRTDRLHFGVDRVRDSLPIQKFFIVNRVFVILCTQLTQVLIVILRSLSR